VQEALQPLARTPLVHHSVQEAIRAYILDRKLQPGDPLPPENELANRLGVSRNSVREAVKALESLGVLVVRRGSGIYVQDFSFEPLLNNLHYGLLFNLRELAELLQIRRVLETGMIGQAMELITTKQISNLEQIVAQMRLRAERNEPFPHEDRAFHQHLFENSDNLTLLRLLDTFWFAFHRAVEQSEPGIYDTDPAWTYRAHAAILEAVQIGDVETARTALDQHYAGLESRVTRAQARVGEKSGRSA
jgi:DNA-binding FadR family transcriptional regulator